MMRFSRSYDYMFRRNMMKKAIVLLVTLATVLSMTSCSVNWFGDTVEVPWYAVAVPVTIILVLGYIILMKRTYICPKCKAEFKAKPYQLYVTVHSCGKRLAKCPKCGRMGFCDTKW